MDRKMLLVVPVLITAGAVILLLAKGNNTQNAPKIGAPVVTTTVPNNSVLSASADMDTEESSPEVSFIGEKGEVAELSEGLVRFETSGFETNKVKFFNTTLASGKTVYYMVLQDSAGNFRAAANANQLCSEFKKGYKQVDGGLECQTCKKTYPIEDFAVAKPDCNPYPINASLPVQDGIVTISNAELESVSQLF